LSFRKDRYSHKWDKYQNYFVDKAKQTRVTNFNKKYNTKVNFKSRVSHNTKFPTYKKKFIAKNRISRNFN
jgi:hypothetical protein